MSSDSGTSTSERSNSTPGYVCYSMPRLQPWSRSWPLDDNGRMTFLKIPHSLNLHTNVQQRGLYGGSQNIANLPPELQYHILSYLPAVDRVCLAITCKSLATSASSSSHFKADAWTPWLFIPEAYYPSRYQLIQRLAHGWIDKSRLRYCWKCQKILPRDKEWFWGRLERKKWPRWEVKVGMPREKWRRLGKKRRFEHIVKMWCEAEWEDSSLFSCKDCRTRVLSQEADVVQERDVEKGSMKDREWERWQAQAKLCPVECPMCMERDLTYRYKPPRKKVVRPFVWKWTKRVLSGIGNTILVFIYLIYLLLKAPVELGIWLFKKCRSSNFSFKRTFFISS
ncbi:hypothetical protein H2198_008718 [Neophaeococcomyces mojaviensis]|uniref:Uncharacterized protein n=1 Tax=Neophaeococcomyces mojaviensis TaxID=3383035 RepID=A0ACC2ZWC9_9EURO|nr:hypothetical protein H2198_008718 [Knufia sp. JES_112]